LAGADHGIDEGVDKSAVGREAIGIDARTGQLGGIAHADQVRRDQVAVAVKLGNDVAPEIRRGRVAVQEQHRRTLAAFVVGDAGVEYIDGLFAERLFGHEFSRLIAAVFAHGRAMTGSEVINRESGMTEARPETGRIANSPP
jgi:hypothetical protein